MYKRKRSGPSTYPWGTPEVTRTSFEDSLPVQQFESDQLKKLQSILECFLLCRKLKVYIVILDD